MFPLVKHNTPNSYPHQPFVSKLRLLVTGRGGDPFFAITGEAVVNSQLLHSPSTDHDQEKSQSKPEPEPPVENQLELLGPRLRWVIYRLTGTVTEFSFVARVSEGNLRRYLAGVALPGSEVLESLYRTGININWLLSGEGCAYSSHAKANGRIGVAGAVTNCCGGSLQCPYGMTYTPPPVSEAKK